MKEVNDGYAQNFLFPRKLAEMATPSAVTELEKRKNNIEIENKIQEELLMKNLEEIKGKVLTMQANTDEKGHLFSGIHSRKLAEEMKTQHRVDISPDFIVLQKPIKATGEFTIPIEIKGKKSSFKLIVGKL